MHGRGGQGGDGRVVLLVGLGGAEQVEEAVQGFVERRNASGHDAQYLAPGAGSWMRHLRQRSERSGAGP